MSRIHCAWPLVALCCLFINPASAAAQNAGPLESAWVAEEDYFKARILINRDELGGLQAFFAGEDLRPGRRLSHVSMEGDSVFFGSHEVDAEFEGVLVEGKILGTWTQGRASVRLTLVPLAAPLRHRPQDPKAPFPYSILEIRFETADGLELNGTITAPLAPGTFPGVVLLQGSGVGDRDATLDGHRPFAVMADYLSRRGVVVLRYDKREGAGLAVLASDARAALAHLRSRPDVGPAGFVSHSEGTMVAPLALADAAFVVLLSAQTTSVAEALVEQNVRLARAFGASQTEQDTTRRLMQKIVEAAASEADSAEVALRVENALRDEGLQDGQLRGRVAAQSSSSFRELVRHEPGEALREVTVPVLAVFGDLDLFTPPDVNAQPLRDALGPRADVHIEPGLNHWLQPASTGLPDEIGRIDVTLSPRVLERIAAFLAEQMR